MAKLTISARGTDNSVSQDSTFSINPLTTKIDKENFEAFGGYWNAVDIYNNTAEPIEFRLDGDPQRSYQVAELGGVTQILPTDGERFRSIIFINRGANAIDTTDTDAGVLATYRRA